MYCLGRKSSVKFWTLTTLESENCDPKRLTSRQQLAYIALRASKGLSSSEIGTQAKENEKPIVSNPKQKPSTKNNVKDKPIIDQKASEDKDNFQEILEKKEEDNIVDRKVEDYSQENVVPELSMMKDLNEIADKSLEEEAEEADHLEVIPEVLSKVEEDPEAELGFLSHDVADFIRSTNDVQRLRSDILESERRNRLTSGY